MRQMKKDLNMCTTEQQSLTLKIAELEDRSRRNNVCLVGLPQSREGDDPIGFLQKMLPTWIPALKKKGRIEIDRAHRVYGSGKSHTLIFHVLRYQDRQAILQGAREVMKTERIRDQDHLLRFFADYSGFTSRR
ncbi:LINE-1 type transposase domain-containing 1 [Labeo rohita]|uniref:LINE-1 type transposase domain-containing 1 n=1 Tax=Labeo rohita TaxID=84645 RepID=A0A498NQS1_LABRO|nr:LINE-1 type transposase domain-containing 1 [Labeo rohita]